MSNFRVHVLEAIQMAWKNLVSIFRDFCKPVVIYPIYISPCSSSDSSSSFWSYDILNLADVANIFVANSISRSLASEAP